MASDGSFYKEYDAYVYALVLRFKTVEEICVHSDVPCQEMLDPIRGLYGLQEQGTECHVVTYV